MEEKLRTTAEKMIGYKPHTPNDFVRLCDRVFQRTHECVSSSTLRRFWGYNHENVRASRYTLDVLSRFVGFCDYDDFCSKGCEDELQSSPVLSYKIGIKELKIGDRLFLTWQPGHSCTIFHKGNGHFYVESSENTRISAGDTFDCYLFVNHEPLYLDNFVHGNSAPGIYVIGKKDGVIVERMNVDS